MHDAGETLRARGLRCTRQRELVYAALRKSGSHPTAEELLAGVRRVDGELSLATVYNTLETLCECGLVRRLASADGSGPCRFDATVEPHAHVTLADGRVIDVPTGISERLLAGMDESALDDLAMELGVDRARLHVRLSVGVESGAVAEAGAGTG